MIKVLVTGANGQLGQCIRDAASDFLELDIFFASRKELDIEKYNEVTEFFRDHSFDYCINTAAYTKVDDAEKELDEAFSINAKAVKMLANICEKSNIVLIHISTDYVFDGKKDEPYLETDVTNPKSVYGASKLKGEQYIEAICDKYFIFRTSWLYSQYGNNFLNTILKFSAQGRSLSITTEQTGTPTNANDLAKMILTVISSRSNLFGLYHFSNEGEATWYDFAKEILKSNGQFDDSKLAKTAHYPTFAERPKYSVLNNSKIRRNFSIEVKGWRESLLSILIK